jgi:hypothetical protein
VNPSAAREPFRQARPLTGAGARPRILHLEEQPVNVERAIRIMAGSFVLLSVALGAEASPLFADARFLWFTAFVGANLLQSGVTRFCPAELVLRKLGMKNAAAPCSTARG